MFLVSICTHFVSCFFPTTVNKLNSEIGMVAVVRAIASSMGLSKESVAQEVDNAARVAEDVVA